MRLTEFESLKCPVYFGNCPLGVQDHKLLQYVSGTRLHSKAQ